MGQVMPTLSKCSLECLFKAQKYFVVFSPTFVLICNRVFSPRSAGGKKKADMQLQKTLKRQLAFRLVGM